MAHHRRDIDFNNNSRRHANSSNTCPSTFAQEAFVVTIEESLTARKSLLSELETTLQEILSRIEVAGVARRRIIAPRINQVSHSTCLGLTLTISFIHPALGHCRTFGSQNILVPFE